MSGLLGHVKLHLVESWDDADAFRRWVKLDREGPLCIDTETTGLSPERDKVRLIQFGDLNEGWAIPFQRWAGLAEEVIENYEDDLGLHNSKFDIRQLCTDLGHPVTWWPWHRTHDTMGLAHINDSQRSKALKSLAAQLVDASAVAGQKSLDEGMTKNKWTWETVPINFPPYWQYGALDPVLTAWIFKKLRHVIDEHPSLYDMEMGAIRVAAKMEETAMRVNLGYSTRKAFEFREFADTSRQWLNDQFRIENPTPAQLTRFFKSADVPLPNFTTPSGTQKMDKDVLQMIDHPVASTVLNIRKAEKLAGTYLENFSKFAVGDLIHPGINTMAARTGRMSITEPALQTLPKRDKSIRRAFIPRDGHVLISCDYDQIEARLTAHFSNDPGLITAFLDDGDFFCNIATPMFGYEVIKGMRERDLTKGVVYGKLYGAGVEKMALTAGVEQVDMARTNRMFETTFSLVPKMQNDIIQAGKTRARNEPDGRGWVQTPFGRKLRADRNKEYTLVNYLIQCHASEVLKSKMVELDAILGDEVKMLLPIHDEILFDCPAEIAQDVKMEIEKAMSNDNYAVPITAGGDIMTRWWGDDE